MNEKFLQDGFEKRLVHLVEECSEVINAACKIQRWGEASVNPLLPVCDQETNLLYLKREMRDLRKAIDRLEQAIEVEFL